MPEGVWWGVDELTSMKLTNLVEWAADCRRGGWAEAFEEADMAVRSESTA